MKQKVGSSTHSHGFALPTILIISTVMIAVLVTSIAAAAASRVALDSQFYNRLAQQAVESGIARANECLKNSGYTPQWSMLAQNRDLRPNTDCTGNAVFGNPYVVGTDSGTPSKVRTSYSIEAPSGSGVGSALKVVGRTELVRTAPPHAVWRSYSQVSYLQIEPPQTIACPDGFISVPGNTMFGTSDFCVSKYEAKNVDGRAASVASGTPYTYINQTDALAASQQACDGCRLINEAEWLTVAHNVTNVASNWSGGSVGSGYIYSGHTDNSPSNALAASTDDDDGYYGTGSTNDNQRRTLRLSNGEVIWDLAGNVTEWTSGQTTGGQPGPGSWAWREWNSISGTGSLSPNPFPEYATLAAASWTSSNGIGRVYSNSSDASLRGYLRSGAYNYASFFPGSAGVFVLYLAYSPTNTASNIGFRMVMTN